MTSSTQGRWIAVACALTVGLAAIIVIVIVIVIVISHNKSGQAAGLAPDGSSSSRPASSPHDWEANVCQRAPIRTNGSALPSSTTEEECTSPYGNPIIIGTYSSSSVMQNDERLIPYDAPYATITDTSGGTAWLFVAFEDSNPGRNTQRVLDPNYVPSAPLALKPLAAFGFQFYHVGK